MAHARSHAALRFDQTFRGKNTMKTTIFARVMRTALIGAAFAGAPLTAHAEIKNYEFQLVQPTVQAGADRIVTVRLVDKTTGKAVPDAVIFARRRCRARNPGPIGSKPPSAWRDVGSFRSAPRRKAREVRSR